MPFLLLYFFVYFISYSHTTAHQWGKSEISQKSYLNLKNEKEKEKKIIEFININFYK